MSVKRRQPDKGSKTRSPAKATAKAKAKAGTRSASKATAPKSATKGTAESGKRAKPAGSKPDQMPPEVLEFIQAIDKYKRLNQRPFPNWSEILEILKELGYEKSAT